MLAWLLAVHLLGMVFWVGALVVLTRVLAAHSEETNTETRTTLVRIERWVFNRIVHPGLVVTLLAGVALIFTNPDYFLHANWLHAKLLLTILLIGLDLWLYVRAGAQEAGREQMTRSECTAFGATIVATFLAILILVLVKPF